MQPKIWQAFFCELVNGIQLSTETVGSSKYKVSEGIYESCALIR